MTKKVCRACRYSGSCCWYDEDHCCVEQVLELSSRKKCGKKNFIETIEEKHDSRTTEIDFQSK